MDCGKTQTAFEKTGDRCFFGRALSGSLLFDHWFTGIGLGSYKFLSPIYLKGFPVNLQWNRAHSEYVELAIALGIPMATLLFTWLFAGVAKMLSFSQSRRSRRRISHNKNIVGTAALCGLIGFLIHGTIDFGWHLPVNFVYAVTLLAIIVTCFEKRSDRMRGLKKEPTQEQPNPTAK